MGDGVFDVWRDEDGGVEASLLAVEIEFLFCSQIRLEISGQPRNVLGRADALRQWNLLEQPARLLKWRSARFQTRPELLQEKVLPAFANESIQRLRMVVVELGQG